MVSDWGKPHPDHPEWTSAYQRCNQNVFCRIPNRQVWQYFTGAEYRPSKRAEYRQNIEVSTPLMVESSLVDSAASLRGYARRFRSGTCHIVNAGPSLEWQLDEINKTIKNPDVCVVAVNKASRILDRIDWMPWTERMADASVQMTPKVDRDGKPTSIITAPYSNHKAIGFAQQRHPIYLHNVASNDWLGCETRGVWDSITSTEQRYPARPHLLELPGITETTQLAIDMMPWMGFKKVYLWGIDYCWYDPDKYYYFGGKPPEPQDMWDRYVAAGREGAWEEERWKWLHTVYETKDRDGKPCFTTNFMTQRAAELAFDCRTQRKFVKYKNMNHRGMLPV